MQHPEEGTIHAWLDGELDAPEAAALDAHVAACATCAALVAEARGLTAASSRILSALDEVPAGVLPDAKAPTSHKPTLVPSAADPAVHRAAGEQQKASPRPRKRFNTQFAAAAAMLVMAVGTWTVLQRSVSSPSLAAPEPVPVTSVPPAESGGAGIASPPPASTPLSDEAASRPGVQAKAGPAQGAVRSSARSTLGTAAGRASLDRVEADAIGRRDAAANEATRQAVGAGAEARKERIDTVREASIAAAPQRLARASDSIVSNEAKRVAADVRAQAALPPPAVASTGAPL
ncbi:MAG: zf-HC2 domain-containing protein, partial [Cytophagaceae bacterium]|nr:zf-HC2 domain-containing protein [Gemmatimonadaceae bacterium]